MLLLALQVLSACDTPCSSSADCPSTQRCVQGFCARITIGGTDAGRDAGTGGAAGQGGMGGGSVQDSGTPDAGPAVTGVEVSAAQATLTSLNGSRPTTTFSARLRYADGTMAPTTEVVFSVDRPDIGDVHSDTGVFTALGSVGGTATVTAAWTRGALRGTASVGVQLRFSFVGQGVPADGPPKFSAIVVTDPQRAAGVVYPLDGVVFPQNVAPPDVQWERSAPGDLFQVVLVKPSATVVATVARDPSNHYVVPEVAWRALAQSDPTAPATLRVLRYEAATQAVIGGVPQSLRFARASLTGSIYYWDIARGRIVRIDDGTTTRTEFMPTPPVDRSGTSRCVGCHAVSPSGRYMVGRLGGGDNIGAVFDLTNDLSGDPPPSRFTLSDAGSRWWFASFNPDETRLAVSFGEAAPDAGLTFLNPATGAFVPVQNLPRGPATHPAWSPDGTRIAYVTNLTTAGQWGGDADGGDIAVVPVTGPDALGPASVILRGATGNANTPPGAAVGYPTWTPDSRKLAFSHGDNVRSETGLASLYLMNPDGSGVVRLSNAVGGPSANDSFQPRFSPFTADGYYWLTYLSRRDYGNAQVGTKGANRQQIWVAAIRVDAGVNDPSEVAYWLPGQATTSQNIAAFWAPRACRQQGQACSVATECCSGDCRSADGGAPVCSPPPPERCRRAGETCAATTDCCSGRGLLCQSNVCTTDVQ